MSIVSLPPISGRPSRRAADHRSLAALGFIAIGVYLFGLAWLTGHTGVDIWGGVVLATILYSAGAVLLSRHLSSVEPDAVVRRIVIAGLFAKLLGAVARYANGALIAVGDAESYHHIGVALSGEFRQFVFGGPALQEAVPKLSGTSFINLLTGTIYTFTGTAKLGGFVAFSFMSFWGLYFFYRAFATAVPDGLRRRYVALLFLFPSTVFWPSSIGKEAWMITMLGLATYGLARIITGQRYGYIMVGSALLGMAIARPHVAALFAVAMTSAFLLRRVGSSRGGLAKKVFGLILLAGAGIMLASQLQAFFGIENPLDVQTVLDETTRRSTQGGSAFDPVNATSPPQVPWAIVTVMFRPFLFEVGGVAGLVTSLETTFLLGLFLVNIARVIRIPGQALQRPFVAAALTYVLLFCVAFSSVGNFGILARQRTQLFPFALLLLALPVTALGTRRRERLQMSAPQPLETV